MAVVLSAGAASASPVNGTGNVTGDVIFGSGNANGSFTGVTVDKLDNSPILELALRGKLRYNGSQQPENTFNYDGVDTYTFISGNAPANKSIFNWEWSINTDVSGLGGVKLNDYTYMMSLDDDPTAGTNFSVAFDPINVICADHAFGSSSTGNGAGTEGTCATYASLISNNSLAQNSWNQGYFGAKTGLGNGLFTYKLEAFDATGSSVGSTSINVQVGAVPLPATLPLLAFALGGFGFIVRRRRDK